MPGHAITTRMANLAPLRRVEVFHNSGVCGCDDVTTEPTVVDNFGVALIRLAVDGPHTFTGIHDVLDAAGNPLYSLSRTGTTQLDTTGSGWYLGEIIFPV